MQALQELIPTSAGHDPIFFCFKLTTYAFKILCKMKRFAGISTAKSTEEAEA